MSLSPLSVTNSLVQFIFWGVDPKHPSRRGLQGLEGLEGGGGDGGGGGAKPLKGGFKASKGASRA